MTSGVNILIFGVASPRGKPYNANHAMWLQEFDVEANEGRGRVVLTPDRSKAKVYDSPAEALKEVRSSPASHPVRLSDGKPNRPLTAYHLEIVPVDKPSLLDL